MAKDHVKLDIVNEKHKDFDKHDDEIEMIFGRPAPVPAKNHIMNFNGNNNNVEESDLERTRQPLLEPSRERQLPPLAGQYYNNNVEESDLERTRQPLLEPNRERQLPPLAGPEIDDLEGDYPKDAAPYPGIDDGLLDTADSKPYGPDLENGDHHPELEPGEKHPEPHDDETEATDGKLPWGHDEPDFPYDGNGLTTRFGDSRPVSPMPGVIPDVNTYQQKKNLAQGMMDLALLSANANQLRYVLESSTTHPYYYSSLVFISLSIIFQILVGVGLIMNSRYDVNNEKERCKADKINNMTVLGIFLITIVNVFITSFSVATQQPGGATFATAPQQTG